MGRQRRRLAATAALVAVLAGLRFAAPYAVESYVDRRLGSLGEYRGQVADVDLNLWRGAYQLHGLEIVKANGRVTTELVRMPLMDLSIQWKSLWKALRNGEVVGEVVMHDAVLNLVQGPAESETQLGTGVNWPDEIRELFPFRLNRVETVNGLVTFRAPGIRTADSLTIRDLRLVLRNLTNVQERESATFADVKLAGRVMGNAPLALKGSINPNEQIATFDIDLSLEEAKLVDVNPWLREFVKVDAEAGAFSMYAEIAAARGQFEGYVKPIMENPEIFRADEESSGPFQKAWEALVGLVAKILENRKEDQVATRIPLAGKIENPDADVLATILSLLRNAFIAALGRSLEGSISLRGVADDLACRAGSESEACEPE